FVFRLRPRRRGALPLADVAGPAALVFLGAQHLELNQPALNRPVEDLLEEGNAPAAAGASPATLGQLARHLRVMQADVILQLPATDPEAEADVVVEVHASRPPTAAPSPCPRPRASPTCRYRSSQSTSSSPGRVSPGR